MLDFAFTFLVTYRATKTTLADDSGNLYECTKCRHLLKNTHKWKFQAGRKRNYFSARTKVGSVKNTFLAQEISCSSNTNNDPDWDLGLGTPNCQPKVLGYSNS